MSARSGPHPSRGRRAIRGALLAPLLVLAMSGLAQAAEVPNHRFIKTLISGLVEEPKPPHPVLDAPCGVVVNPDGSILVSEYYGQKIFHTSLPEFSLPDFFPNNGPCGLASDGSNVYVNYWHGAVVNADFGVIDPGPATGVAVDPATGDLYVDHRTSIAVYKAPVHSGEVPLEIGAGSLLSGYGVAVSDFPATAGDIYAADAATNTVKVYNPATSLTNPIKVINGAGTAAGRFVSLKDASLALEQATGHLFVVDNIQPGAEHSLAAVDEFNAEGLYRGQLEHEIIDSEPTGIAVDESVTESYGQVYVTSGNGSIEVILSESGPPESEQGKLFVFGTSGAGQKVTVTRSGAGQGSVDSNPAGIACPGSCAAELNSGATVTLTATPEPGSTFAGWSGACSGTGSCQVTLSAAATVNAEFALAPLVIGIGAAAPAMAADSPIAPAASNANVSNANALIVGRPTANDNGTVALEATAAGPGTLIATAKGLRPARVRFARAGSLTLHLNLNAAGRRALSERKSGLLALRVALAFKPSPGGVGSALGRTIIFKRAGGWNR